MRESKDPGADAKREFVLAGSVFVLLAVVATVFGLWMVHELRSNMNAGHQQPPVAKPGS